MTGTQDDQPGKALAVGRIAERHVGADAVAADDHARRARSLQLIDGGIQFLQGFQIGTVVDPIGASRRG